MMEEEKEKNFGKWSHDFFIMFSRLSDYDCAKILTALSEMRKIQGILPDEEGIILIFMFLASTTEDCYKSCIEDLKRERKKMREDFFSYVLEPLLKDD
jgi:hypothetical protein